MPMRIVCLGDSITAGVSQEESWVALLQRSSSHTWINAGIVGDIAVGMLCRLQDCIRHHRPDMLIWLGGVNDILLTGSRDLPVSCTMAAVHQCVAAGVLPVVGIPYSIAPSEITEPVEGLHFFVEERPVGEWVSLASCVVCYRWNRHYPADQYFDIDLSAMGFALWEREDFPGSSHETITREVYVK